MVGPFWPEVTPISKCRCLGRQILPCWKPLTRRRGAAGIVPSIYLLLMCLVRNLKGFTRNKEKWKKSSLSGSSHDWDQTLPQLKPNVWGVWEWPLGRYITSIKHSNWTEGPVNHYHLIPSIHPSIHPFSSHLTEFSFHTHQMPGTLCDAWNTEVNRPMWSSLSSHGVDLTDRE